jgi:hypothetical protein
MIAARARRWRCRSRTLRSAGHARHMSAARRELPLRASAINNPSLPVGRTLVAILPRPACTIADACCRTTPATPRSGPTARSAGNTRLRSAAPIGRPVAGASAIGDARCRATPVPWATPVAGLSRSPKFLLRRPGALAMARPALLALKRIGARGRSDHRVRLERRLLTWVVNCRSMVHAVVTVRAGGSFIAARIPTVTWTLDNVSGPGVDERLMGQGILK